MCAARKKKKEYVIGRFIVYINGKEVLKTDSFKDACALVDRSRRGAEALLYDSFLKTFDVQSMRSELCRRAESDIEDYRRVKYRDIMEKHSKNIYKSGKCRIQNKGEKRHKEEEAVPPEPEENEEVSDQ